MAIRQIRIFVPPSLHPDAWAETVMALVVKPMVDAFSPDWIWFTRYEEGPEDSNVDCDLSRIPEAFGPGGIYRSLRFRFSIPDAAREQFEQAAIARIESSGFKVSGFLDYPYIDDLASDRFIAEPRTPERKRVRAGLMIAFLDASARLFLDALTGPDDQGLYHVEENPSVRSGSSFLAIRHLFCNMTSAPTPIFVDHEGKPRPHPSGEIQFLVPPA